MIKKFILTFSTFLYSCSVLYAYNASKIELDLVLGHEVLKKILLSLPQDKDQQTTSFRQENKWFTKEESWNAQINALKGDLKQHFGDSVKIVAREIIKKDAQGNDIKNLSLTLYGKPFKVRYHELSTTITFRIRYYLQGFFNPELKIWNYKRAINEKNGENELAFMEVKVKNPKTDLSRGVVKLRAKMKDEWIKDFWNHKYDWDKWIDKSKNQEAKSTLLIIKELSELDVAFIQPLFGVMYERSSHKIDFNSIQYQLTVDKNIEFFKVPTDWNLLWSLPYNHPLPKTSEIEEYFCDMVKIKYDFETYDHCNFPKNAIAGEVKIPFPNAAFPVEKMDEVHKMLHEHFLYFFAIENGGEQKIFPGMEGLRGKAGHFRSALFD